MGMAFEVSAEERERFLARAKWNDYPHPKLGTPCLVWQQPGRRYQGTHGQYALDGRPMGAHRASWLIHRGEIPGGLWVLHRCDNPPCVNPDHLFLGTCKDNVRDMINKGRKGKPLVTLWRNPKPGQISIPRGLLDRLAEMAEHHGTSAESLARSILESAVHMGLPSQQKSA